MKNIIMHGKYGKIYAHCDINTHMFTCWSNRTHNICIINTYLEDDLVWIELNFE